MITINSISGGKTSAYIYANYPADYNIFSLVTSSDPSLLWMKGKDEKTRQAVSDRIGREFIGTLEEDVIIYTILDLEQKYGRRIEMMAGITFDEVVETKGGWLPNKLHRYCTTNLKLVPMFEWWYHNIGVPVEMRIGFRANEIKRADRMIDRSDPDGLLEFKHTFEKHKDGRNKWDTWKWQKPAFPLIEDRIYKDTIEKYWKEKDVRFAWMNNCVGCFHRNEMLLKRMFEREPEKMEWFSSKEAGRDGRGTWRTGITYEQIKKHKLQFDLFDEDFNDCDSGYCGI